MDIDKDRLRHAAKRMGPQTRIDSRAQARATAARMLCGSVTSSSTA